MLPYAEHLPALAAKGAIDESIAKSISIQLVLPELAIRPRKRSVFSTAMPKTTINKNCEALLLKDKVRISERSRISTPASNSLPPKQRQ